METKTNGTIQNPELKIEIETLKHHIRLLKDKVEEDKKTILSFKEKVTDLKEESEKERKANDYCLKKALEVAAYYHEKTNSKERQIMKLLGKRLNVLSHGK